MPQETDFEGLSVAGFLLEKEQNKICAIFGVDMVVSFNKAIPLTLKWQKHSLVLRGARGLPPPLKSDKWLPRECHEGFVASDLGHCCGTARCHECRWECFLERLVLLGHHVRNRLKGTPRRKATPKIRLEAVMRAAQQKMPGLHGAWRGSPGIVRLRRHGPVAAAVRTERVAVMAASL